LSGALLWNPREIVPGNVQSVLWHELCSRIAKELGAANLHFGALDKKNNVGAMCKNPGLFEEQHNS
jgi:hypothetical protein